MTADDVLEVLKKINDWRGIGVSSQKPESKHDSLEMFLDPDQEQQNQLVLSMQKSRMKSNFSL